MDFTTIVRPEIFLAIIVSLLLFSFGLIGKNLVLMKMKRKDNKAIGVELSTTGIGIYLTIVGAYPKLVPTFWHTFPSIEFTNYFFYGMLLVQIILWGLAILCTNRLIRTLWRDTRAITLYTLGANFFGISTVCICFLVIFFGRIIP